MADPLSPLALLAVSMQAQPGMYAVLLGSGVSAGADIPTGWGVIQDLVGSVAAATAPEDESAVRAARDNPEAWWSEHGEGELGYGRLLEALATLPADRQGILAGFFEPKADDAGGLRQPSKAHQAIAELVKRGYVRVIITTNFDRLMEQALEAAGVSAQVVSRPGAVHGMTPLVHAPATIIKLHGDYKDADSLNTPAELATYPAEWTRLLAQIFDEYGLVISGWSADWDTALVQAITDTPNHRYPLYWGERSCQEEKAADLLRSRGGRIVPASSADALFTELLESVEALERLAVQPLTTAMAVTRLKRYLPDRTRRIDLYNLVMQSTDAVVTHIEHQDTIGQHGAWPDVLEGVYAGYFRSMEQLTQLLIAGVWHDQDGKYDQLWFDVLQRLVEAGTRSVISSHPELGQARRIPALIALAVIGMTATRRDRDGLFIRLSTEVDESEHPGQYGGPEPAAQALHYHRIWEPEWINNLPRWNGVRWHYPASHLMKADLRQFFKGSLEGEAFANAYHDFEYRLGLVQMRTGTSGHRYRANMGEYADQHLWERDGETPKAETRFKRALAKSHSDSWQQYFGGADQLEAEIKEMRGAMDIYRRP